MAALTFEEPGVTEQRLRFLRLVFGKQEPEEPPPWTMGDVKLSQALWGVADLKDLSDGQVDKLARVLCMAVGEELTAVNLNSMAARIGCALFDLEQEVAAPC